MTGRAGAAHAACIFELKWGIMGRASINHGNRAKRHRNHVLAGRRWLGMALPLHAQSLGHATGGDGGEYGSVQGGAGGSPGRDGAEGTGAGAGAGDAGGVAPGGVGGVGQNGRPARKKLSSV